MLRMLGSKFLSCESHTFDLVSLKQTIPSLTYLVICCCAHGELKRHASARQFPIYLTVSVEPMIHPATLLLIEYHLQQFATIFAGPGAFSNNFNGVDQIAKDSIVHGSKSTAAWPFLCL